MKQRFYEKKSIVFRLTALILVIIILQTALLTFSMIGGGVLAQGKLNAYQNFYEKVSGRKNHLEREMKNRWTNLDPFTAAISEKISMSPDDADQILHQVSEDLIFMLRSTQTTGVFLILADKTGERSYPALHLRDYDPLTNGNSSNDIYLLMGPDSVGEEQRIPLDQTWSYRYRPPEEGHLFFERPMRAAAEFDRPSLSGYWSPPFYLTEKDLPIITYSIPLFDEDKNLRGILGVEVTLNYLVSLLPKTDLQPKDGLGYVLVYQEKPDSPMMPILFTGALQKRFLAVDRPLIPLKADENLNIYRLFNEQNKESLYSCIMPISLYRNNTPYEEETWSLVGLMREDNLLSYVHRIQYIIMAALLVSLVLGMAGGLYFSNRFTRPIVRLADFVRDKKNEGFLPMDKTGLLEVDELAAAMAEANKDRMEAASRLSRIIGLLDVPIGAFELRDDQDQVFVTEGFYDLLSIPVDQIEFHDSREGFLALLEQVTRNPEPEETHIYKVGDRWIKYTSDRDGSIFRGIIQDVTPEMKEKRAIRKDRDLDPLTGLLNRKAFQYQVERVRFESEAPCCQALLMVDLDNLKPINDTYGHQWGDQYILESVRELKALAERNNTILGRRSGDEFLLFFRDWDSKEELSEYVAGFFAHLTESRFLFPDGERLPVSMSGGLLWLDGNTLSYDEILHYADEALYQSKRKGKGIWTIHERT